MQDLLETIAASGFTPESVRRAADSHGAGPCRRGTGAGSYEGAKELLDASCAALPEAAVQRITALIYLDALKAKQERLASAAGKMLEAKSFPALHYEMNPEEAVLAELFDALMAEGAAAEDWDFVSRSSCVALGTAWYAVSKAHEYIMTADVTTALNLEAIRGEMGAFDDRLSSIARPFPGQIDCAYNVRRLAEGSQMTTNEGRAAFGYDKHPRVQDAICVRATPQTHGGVRDIWSFAAEAAGNAAEGRGSLFTVEYALDGLETALADLAHISERRTFRLNDTRLSYGLPMNLTHGATGLNHGFPVVQSNQAAFVAELKLLVLPSSCVKAPGSCAAYFAAAKMLRALPLTAKVLAIELLMTCQGMDIVAEKLPGFSFGKGTAAVKDKVRESIEMMKENRFVSPDMNEADRLITSGAVLDAAEHAVGGLR